MKWHLGCCVSVVFEPAGWTTKVQTRRMWTLIVEQAYQYLTDRTYPNGATENRNRAIRNKARDGELCHFP